MTNVTILKDLAREYELSDKKSHLLNVSLTNKVAWYAFCIYFSGSDDDREYLRELISVRGSLNGLKGVVSKSRKVALYFKSNDSIATGKGFVYRSELIASQTGEPYKIPVTTLYNSIVG